MPTLLFLHAASCVAVARDTEDAAHQDTAAQVQQQVQEVAEQVDAQSDRLAALERYLTDKTRAANGEAPKGWVQPPLEDYLKPGAPTSFIPAPPAPAVVADAPRAVGAKGPQP